MSTAKITSKRQITVPKDVCEELAVDAGDEIEFVKASDGFRVRKRVDPAVFDKYRGILKLGKKTDQIIEEMRGPVDLD